MSRLFLVAVLAATALLAIGPAAQAAPPTPTPILWREVSAGGNHTCGVRFDESLWCWGSNSHGQLGVGDLTARSRPAQVLPGTLWMSVSAGHRHTCGLSIDYALYCWGANDHRQLGIGSGPSTTVPTLVPGLWMRVATSFFHTCAIKVVSASLADGELWCWGWNDEAQLGTGDRTTRDVPARVRGARLWWQIRTGYAHTCALDETARMFCWGRGDHGQLGLGDTTDRVTPQPVGIDPQLALAVGADHTCAIIYREPWLLRCWGRNHQGQLGVGGYVSSTVPVVVPLPASAPAGDQFDAVTTQDSHTCAWTFPSATAWCWGWNAFGQLGIGTTTGSPTPVRLGLRPLRVSPGVAHTCALRTDRTMWCWGKNEYGQLGLGDTVDRTTPAIIGPLPTTPPPHP
jgi:alpha-tubulin suppressor-like RCC1 family protein